MKHAPGRLRAVCVASAFCLTATSRLTAQAVPSDAAAGADEIIELSPFTVESSEGRNTYQATSTLAGTRVRTDLKDVASPISVVTSQFLQDTGARNTQDLLVYTPSTEVGGIRGNYSGMGGGTTFSETANLLRPANNTRVRGLDSADNTRDYFLTEIPWDGYIVDRVDLQRGPNSILFGVGSPGGIVNSSLNTATYKNENKIENRVGRFGSVRWSGDFNYVVVPNELAIRVAALDDETKYQQDPAFNHDKRVYGALRYEPKLFGEGARTQIRVNFEKGNVDANRPRSLPPIDAITPWFRTGAFREPADNYLNQNLNQLTLNPLNTWTQYGDTGYAWFREAFMGRLLSSNIANFYNAGSNAPLVTMMPNIGTSKALDKDGNRDGTIGGIPFARPYGIATLNNFARVAVPGGQFYSNVSLSDPSIYDFYNYLIDGDNKREWQNWKASNIALSQTFLNDRLGFELVYDYQRYDDGQIAFLGGDQYQISVDINTHLLDGTPNPNVGRPYVGNSGQYNNSEDFIDRDSIRFTTFAELRAEDWMKKGWLATLLGRHVFTGLLSEDVKRSESRTFARWAAETAYTDATGGSAKIIDGARQIDWIAYLGPSLAGASSASGAHLNPVTAIINPSGTTTVKYFDSTWNAPAGVNPGDPWIDPNAAPGADPSTQSENPANYVGWTTGNFGILNADNPADLRSLYTSGQKARNQIESRGITWQGYLWDGNIVPVFGWRRDEVKNASSQAPKDPVTEVSLLDYGIDESAANTKSTAGESKSWGLVLHTPQQLRDKLPWRTNVSLFYNRSENFKADAPRGDIFGNQIANPDGKTKDYGFVLSTLNDRLTFKTTWYETKVKNATLQADSAGFSSNLYYVWALPYWGATHALAALDGIADPQLRQGNWGWPWNGIAVDENNNPDNARIYEIVEDFFTSFPLDQHFADEYGIGLNVAAMRAGTTPADWYASVPTYGVDGQGASALGLQPAYGGRLGSFGSGPVASVDTTSKGIEFELTAQPVKNWNITANASKTKATRDAISPTIDTWIATYTDFLAGDAGLIKLWGGDPIRKVWADNVLAPYSVLKAQLGSSAPEIPEWRFNLVTSYYFDHGPIKGVNVGGAYRWEDKRILGYGLNDDASLIDISKPLYGPTDDHYDLWVGYQRKLTSKIGWHIQLNLRNVGESAHLVPVTVQPDGSAALSRIQEGMTWQLTNTFTF
ncbi:MAG TPA: TonB-dependent receptor plug domain-containing protein [Opitutaceae bacterium]